MVKRMLMRVKDALLLIVKVARAVLRDFFVFETVRLVLLSAIGHSGAAALLLLVGTGLSVVPPAVLLCVMMAGLLYGGAFMSVLVVITWGVWRGKRPADDKSGV